MNARPWGSTLPDRKATHAFWRETREVHTHFDPDAEPVDFPREKLVLLPVERRRYNFEEVEQPWREPVAICQSQRCLRCDYDGGAKGGPQEE